MKFIENKNYVKISMENYLTQLREKLSNILEYSNENQQLKKFSIDTIKLRKHLDELSYPRVGPMLIALATGDSKSVCKEYDRFTHWLSPHGLTNEQVQQGLDALAMLFEYKGHLFRKELPFNEENIDQVVTMAESYSSEFIQKIAQKIRSIISKRNFQTQVLLNAVMPPEGFIVEQIEIIMGGDPVAVTLLYEEVGLCPKITRTNDLDLCTETVKRDYETLCNELGVIQHRSTGVKTVYMIVDESHRKQLEQIKRKVALGLQEEVPSVWNLSSTLEGAKERQSKGSDIWKLRIDSNCIVEENNQCKWLSNDPTPVRWLERVS
jgi:hypothetical protein